MITILLVILTFIVAPVVILGLALCRSAALADRKMENLRSGILSDYSVIHKPSEMDIPTTPIRCKPLPS
jgi:hypothetical protein